MGYLERDAVQDGGVAEYLCDPRQAEHWTLHGGMARRPMSTAITVVPCMSTVRSGDTIATIGSVASQVNAGPKTSPVSCASSTCPGGIDATGVLANPSPK